jgi:hypothetical protein
MIIELLLNLIIGLIKIIFSFINLPQLPDVVKSALDGLFDAMASGASFLYILVPREFLLICVPLLVILINFDKIYKFMMWIINKLPLGIE